MARCVDQIQVVDLPVARLVVERSGLRLDGDATLLLDVHRVQHLLAHLAIGQAATEGNDAVGQRGLAVIDVRDDRKIADVVHQEKQLYQGNKVPTHKAAGNHKKGRVSC
ncbi:hypothetical protein D9M68_699870 [compost metagenome]